MRNCFELLPVEVLEHLFLYLETTELIKILKVYPQFEFIYSNRQLNSKINLQKNYEFTPNEFSNFILKKPRCDFITSLNINCLYWIPAGSLRKSLSALTFLERLYAIDTELSFLKDDYVLYKSMQKLKRLAVSTSRCSFYKEENCDYFPPLTHLYLHIKTGGIYIALNIIFMIKKFQTVEELWLIETGNNKTLFLETTSLPSCIKNCTFSFHPNLDFCVSSDLKSGSRWFKSNFNGEMQSCWEKDTCITPLHELADGNLFWLTLISFFISNCPFSMKQTKELLLKKHTFQTMQFQELNFKHMNVPCETFYKSCVGTILLYSNMRFLKKLSLNFCAFLELTEDGLSKHTGSINNLLQRVSENSSYLEELELWYCDRVSLTCITEYSMKCIVNFKYLRKLSFDNIPPYLNPSFLVDICSKCTYLTSLRITSQVENIRLYNMLCLALKKTVTLKDLRYEYPHKISIDQLFNALITNKKLKLERIFLKCAAAKSLDIKLYKTYLQTNKSIKFLYAIIGKLSETVVLKISKSLEELRNDPQKIIVITKDELSYKHHIPYFHVFEMIKHTSYVSVLDVFNGFV